MRKINNNKKVVIAVIIILTVFTLSPLLNSQKASALHEWFGIYYPDFFDDHHTENYDYDHHNENFFDCFFDDHHNENYDYDHHNEDFDDD